MRWCRRRGRGVVAVEVMPERVPLLVEVDPSYGVHRLVKAITGGTSRVRRDEFQFGSLPSRLPTVWTSSYFVATTGGAPVGRYVEQRDW
jgi:putative transposase